MAIETSLFPIQFLAPSIVLVFLLYFLLQFFKKYNAPGKALKDQLMTSIKEVKDTQQQRVMQQRQAMEKIFASTPLEHCWKEFSETLHDQYLVEAGERQVVKIRATVPAAFHFSIQKVIDTPLGTEYFKHLPGVLTGIGIIGTFFGLILGLTHFNPSDPAAVQQSVSRLLQDVTYAFIGSALSIFAAIFVTVREKAIYRDCVGNLEALTEAIDRLFDAGVGEEYLSELVRHTQESAAQTRLLKDSLVSDLKVMLQNLVDTQVRENQTLASTLAAAYKDSSQHMATQISESISSSLREPLAQLSQSVQQITGDQSAGVQSLLQDVLVAFMQKLETTFGNQFSGMQEMLQQSIGSMQQMQAMFGNLVADIRNASQSSSAAIHEQLSRTLIDMQSGQAAMQAAMEDMVRNLQMAVVDIGTEGAAAGAKMGEQLAGLFAQSEARQAAMAEQMDVFIGRMKDTMEKGQSETLSAVAATVETLGDKLQRLVGNFEQNRANFDDQARASQQQLQSQTSTLLDALGTQVQGLIRAMQEGQDATRVLLAQMAEQTTRHIDGLRQGAAQVQAAAGEFAHAGVTIREISQASTALAGQLTQSAHDMQSAGATINASLAEYRRQAEALAKSVTLLDGLVANALAEAGMRGQVLADMKGWSERMQALNAEANGFLMKVNDVVTHAFDAFGSGVEKSLGRSLASYDAELDKAIKALAGGVSDLSENIEDLAELVDKATRIPSLA